MSKKIYFIALTIFIIDQVSKSILSTYLKLNESIEVIKNFFYLKYINNTGASWGILKDSRILLIIISFIAIIILLRYMYNFKRTKMNTLGFGFLLGGILGNLSDRILFGYVKDFFDFYIFKYDFPVFNIADIFIVLGVIILIISILRGEDKNGSSSK
ncbi:MAG: signal peptidase II [Bacilli bacterium]|nr:signal peptidase II [Bacilli bacterium]